MDTEKQDYKIVWINKGAWKKPGPIVYMGLMNALSFAWKGYDTEFFVHASENDQIASDITEYYGQAMHPLLKIKPVASGGGRFRRRIYELALESISQYCREGKTVLVLTRELGILSTLTRMKKKYPLLKVLHEVHDYYATIRHLPKRRLSDYRRMISERMSFGSLDGLICLTEYQRALYQQWFPSLPMIALPLGALKRVKFHANKIEQRRARRRVAYIGHLHEEKGLQLIFRLARQLKDKNIEITCYGGHATHIAALAQRAAEQGFAQILSFVPFLSPSQLNHVLEQDVSIGLVPLQDTYYCRYLTCPVKALDFMSHGIPIVGSDIPSVREVTGKTELIANCGNEQAYAEKICELLDSKTAYANACQAEIARSEQISWPDRAGRIIEFASA